MNKRYSCDFSTFERNLKVCVWDEEQEDAVFIEDFGKMIDDELDCYRNHNGILLSEAGIYLLLAELKHAVEKIELELHRGGL